METDLYKLYNRVEGVKSIEFARMDIDKYPTHPAVQEISHGNHYPAMFLYPQHDKEDPIDYSVFCGPMGPQEPTNELLGMLLWYKMWSDEDMEYLKKKVPEKVLDAIHKHASK